LSTSLEKRGPDTSTFSMPNDAVDPFAPAPRRTLRMAEQYATLRVPQPATNTVGRRSTLVASTSTGRRAISDGAVWMVSGALVTEGVPSTTNGRGGRVTSGTSAAHHVADFLRKVSASEEQRAHSRRLALAMGVDQDAQVLDHSSPSSPCRSGASTPSGRQWRDCV
jgi:meiosis-specific APC/C activator protein AMA1